MKKIIYILLIFLAFYTTNAQILDPVKWTTKIEKKSETSYLLTFNGVIDEGWHLYSQFTTDGGSLPMEITFENQKGNYNLVGKAKESKTTIAFNDDFGVNETFFEKKAQIQQEIILLNPKFLKINAILNYQVCKDACINLEKKFTFIAPKSIANTIFSIEKDTPKVAIVPLVKEKAIIKKVSTISEPKKEDEKGLWTIFFLAFLGGLAALLTPCVFPMIPLTVSFFTKHSGSRRKGIINAVFYGFSIIFIYVGLGLLITGIFGADALNKLSTSVIFNLIFFVILVFFAISFLGAFEIVLPQSWANKVDKQAEKSGILGIFFMALALAIVSFSCTGPIVGTLLVESASKGGFAPIIGMLGFSLAIALPFMLFALFPTWMHSLPKSGGWMNTVKVCLGFLELALAFKFLSNADLVLQLHFLEREVFIAIWIAIFGAWSLYLFGKITLPHDNPLTFISVGRMLLGLLVLTFTIYIIPGLWGAPLKLINAFPPPIEYSESPFGIGGSSENISKTFLPNGAKYGPNQIIVFDDYDNGLAYAKKINKPIMLDFTGHACVNCRKMENNVWADKRILPTLKNELVIISLHVDDKRELPKNQQFISKSTGAEIETIGDKWTDFMISKYKTNTQPLYVLTDLKGNNLNPKKPTISYVSLEEYMDWLKAGISDFKK